MTGQEKTNDCGGQLWDWSEHYNMLHMDWFTMQLYNYTFSTLTLAWFIKHIYILNDLHMVWYGLVYYILFHGTWCNAVSRYIRYTVVKYRMLWLQNTWYIGVLSYGVLSYGMTV